MIFERLVPLLGDWRFFWPSTLVDLAHIPYTWDSFLNTGLGQASSGTLWITSYLHLTSFLVHFGIPWFFIGLLFWQLPSILLSGVGMFVLSRTLFPQSKAYAVLASAIYLLNSYFLLLFFGGQAGVSLAYGLLPFAVLTGIRFLTKPSLRNVVILGLVLATVLLFDPRVFIIAVLVLSILFPFIFSFKKIARFLTLSVLVGLVVFFSHIFWILPQLMTHSIKTPLEVGGVEAFRFFSFGGFDYALALLQPNWPENMFGKTSFLQPIFLMFPIVAFSSLLFISKTTKKIVIGLVFLAIIGAFLAKGAQDPFGNINVFLFEYLPGMSLFRDTTKFYMLIAISYALLIPYALSEVGKILPKKLRFTVIVQDKVVVSIFLVFLFTMSIPFLQKGLRVLAVVPASYESLQSELSSDTLFFRTLWIPSWQRFGYFASNHPAIGRGELIKDVSLNGVQQFFASNNAEQELQDWSIRYIVVPHDSEQEIFMRDGEYDATIREQYIRILDDVPYLTKNTNHSPIILYEVSKPRGHFWSPDAQNVLYTQNSPTTYAVTLNGGMNDKQLVFSESYSQDWVVEYDGKSIPSTIRNNAFNSFLIPGNVSSVVVRYKVQSYYYFGILISAATVATCIVFVMRKKKKK